MKSSEGFVRMRTLQGVVLFIFLLIAGRLAYIQLVDSKYNELAKANVLRHVVQYPPRGEVFDRNGEYLVQSRECYDLMVIYSEIDKHGFDTLRMCDVLGLSRGKLEKELANARMRPRAPRVVTNYISKEDKLRFDECNFRGFYTVYRTVRRYPRKIGGNLLGYVSEVNADYLKRNPEYKIGDYVGMGGVESAYEPLLRGTKGVKIQEIDTHGAIKGSYMNGVYDSLPEPGKYIVSTIDARLQLLGEELMRGKVGAAVAIEPSTGEILMMVSSPTYDPDELVGRERGNNYMKMLGNKRQPLYNRAVRAKYPPGSTFKLVQGLIGLQEGVLRPTDLHVCHEGYQAGRRRMKCHSHASPLDLRFAVATSCNAYFAMYSAISWTIPNTGTSRKGTMPGKSMSRASVSAASWVPTSSTSATGMSPTGLVRPPVPRVVEFADGHFARHRAGCAGLHAVAAGQPRGHRRQPRLLLHPAYRQEGRGAGFARPPFLRAPLYEGRPQAFRADRRGHVAGRQRRRHVDAGPARRARCLR